MPGWASGTYGDVVTNEGAIDLDQRLLLIWGQIRIGMNVHLKITPPLGLQDSGPDVERLRRNGQALGDLLEDLG